MLGWGPGHAELPEPLGQAWKPESPPGAGDGGVGRRGDSGGGSGGAGGGLQGVDPLRSLTDVRPRSGGCGPPVLRPGTSRSPPSQGCPRDLTGQQEEDPGPLGAGRTLLSSPSPGTAGGQVQGVRSAAMGIGCWFQQRRLLTGPGQWCGVPWDLGAMVGAGQGHSWGCLGSVTSGPTCWPARWGGGTSQPVSGNDLDPRVF